MRGLDTLSDMINTGQAEILELQRDSGTGLKPKTSWSQETISKSDQVKIHNTTDF